MEATNRPVNWWRMGHQCLIFYFTYIDPDGHKRTSVFAFGVGNRYLGKSIAHNRSQGLCGRCLCLVACLRCVAASLRRCALRRPSVCPSFTTGRVCRAPRDFRFRSGRGGGSGEKQDKKKIGLLALFLSEKLCDREADGATRLRLSQSHWSARKIP